MAAHINYKVSTSYSEYVTWALLIITMTISLPVCVLMYLRRNVYPLNGCPWYLPVISHIGCPIGICGFMGLYIGELPNCWTRKLSVSAGYFPAVHCIFLMLIYVYLCYRVQCEKSLAVEKRHFPPKLISARYMLLYHCALFLVFAVPNLIIPWLFKEEEPGTQDCVTKNNSVSKLLSMVIDLLIKIACVVFCIRIAILLKNVQEAFNFKDNAKKLGKYCITVCVPVSIADSVGGFILPASITIHLSFVARTAWSFIFVTHLLWSGVMPLYISFKEQRRRARIYANQSKKRSSAKFNYAHNVQELQHALYSDDQLARDFQLYVVKEFCVENMLFIEDMKKLRRLISPLEEGMEVDDNAATPTIEIREITAKLKDLMENYLVQGADTEINVSMRLKNNLRTALTQAIDLQSYKLAEPSLQEAEKQVLQMLMGPYNRFITDYQHVIEDDDGSYSNSASTKAGSRLSPLPMSAIKIAAAPPP